MSNISISEADPQENIVMVNVLKENSGYRRLGIDMAIVASYNTEFMKAQGFESAEFVPVSESQGWLLLHDDEERLMYRLSGIDEKLKEYILRSMEELAERIRKHL